MDLQKILAEAQARADANGDGKLSLADLHAMADRHGIDTNLVDNLKQKIDHNGDGKIDVEDAKSALGNMGNGVGNVGDHAANVVDSVKNTLFGKDKK